MKGTRSTARGLDLAHVALVCPTPPSVGRDARPAAYRIARMTTYRRQGHWRRGPSGNRHWVAAHSVTRGSSASRRSTTARSAAAPLRVKRTAPRQPFSTRWARPNARCPVCGALVYFYANEHGSRVYFDELGPPWPKHPCTDIPRAVEATGRVAPAPYAPQAPLGAGGPPERGEVLSAGAFAARYQGEPWTAHVVLGTATTEGGVSILRTLPLGGWRRPKEWRSNQRLTAEVGQVVFIRKPIVTYVDLETLEIRSIHVTADAPTRRLWLPWRRDTSS